MKYTAIADISNALAERLREHMVPDIVKSPDQIGLCAPSQKSDFAVGIYLYDIKGCEEMNNHDMVTLDVSRQKYPSSYMSLFYMITAYSNGDVRYRADEELRLLGKVIQVLMDYAVFENAAEAHGSDASCIIEMLNLPLEEKMHLFNTPDTAYKTSLFYKMGPVEIESEKIKRVQRVVDITFGMDEVNRERPL